MFLPAWSQAAIFAQHVGAGDPKLQSWTETLVGSATVVAVMDEDPGEVVDAWEITDPSGSPDSSAIYYKSLSEPHADMQALGWMWTWNVKIESGADKGSDWQCLYGEVRDAEKKAEQVLADGQKKLDDNRRNVESEIKLAAKQAISALKQDISNLVSSKIIDAPLADSFNDKKFVMKLVESVVNNWGGQDSALEVVVSDDMKNELDNFIKGKSGSTVTAGFDSNLKGGFKIGPADGSFKISFTEDGFAAFFKDYLRPRAVKFLFDEE